MSLRAELLNRWGDRLDGKDPDNSLVLESLQKLLHLLDNAFEEPFVFFKVALINAEATHFVTNSQACSLELVQKKLC